MPLFAAGLLVALLLAPGAVALYAFVRVRARFRDRLSDDGYRAVRGCWLAGAACLFVAPGLTLYAQRTTVGAWSMPAPGLVAFRVAGWLVLGGFALVAVAALAGIAGVRR